MNWGPLSTVGAVPAKKLIPETPQGNHPLMDWGSFPHRDEEKGDYQLATWTIDQLKHASKDQPFFLAAVSSCPTSLVMQPKPGLTVTFRRFDLAHDFGKRSQ